MPPRFSGLSTRAHSAPVAPTPIEVPQPAPDVVPTPSSAPEIVDPPQPNQHPPVREPDGPGDPVVAWYGEAAA
jgi:hypothetical protein